MKGEEVDITQHLKINNFLYYIITNSKRQLKFPLITRKNKETHTISRNKLIRTMHNLHKENY